jgi:hypothetical protein
LTCINATLQFLCIVYLGEFWLKEEVMRRIGLTLTAAAALIAFGTLADRLQAAPFAPEGLRAALGSIDIIQKAQFVWHGRRYCWYDDGWQGPGFYWCGYAKRHGLGWGGGEGWHGWRQGVQPERRQQQDRRPKGDQQQGVQPKSAAPKGDQQQGVQPKGVAPQGGQPKSVAPQGAAPQGVQPNSVAPKGDQQQGGPPKGDQPQGGSPKGDQNK